MQLGKRDHQSANMWRGKQAIDVRGNVLGLMNIGPVQCGGRAACASAGKC